MKSARYICDFMLAFTLSNPKANVLGARARFWKSRILGAPRTKDLPGRNLAPVPKWNPLGTFVILCLHSLFLTPMQMFWVPWQGFERVEFWVPCTTGLPGQGPAQYENLAPVPKWNPLGTFVILCLHSLIPMPPYLWGSPAGGAALVGVVRGRKIPNTEKFGKYSTGVQNLWNFGVCPLLWCLRSLQKIWQKFDL